ncbi:DUF4129 domain-containing protein [Microbacterium foliorum]|uniref:DUF4129 domain-containing protein n=1 Tax=Microbacterium TaxID=33882 RepID=UPI00099F4E32|nr:MULTISPECIES: DUF4129 domain-containing protein [Microbacterium]AQY01950.1 hypothetical protein B2G67_11075 [Microbacterium foliorum]
MPIEHQTRPARRSVDRMVLPVVVVVLFGAAMIASAIQGQPTFRPTEPIPEGTAEPLPTVSPGGTGLPEPVEVEPTNAALAQTLTVILMLLVAAGIVALLVIAARALLRAWRDRPLRRRDAAVVASEVDQLASTPTADVAVGVMQRGIAGALATIDERATASDAIVAAWIGLEESAADAGVKRAASETPGEFVVRIITLRPGAADDAAALLRLYESVRFGTRVADEHDRASARQALRRIEGVWR